ncbi:dynein regulatory complex protein 1 [Diretmus argenteus]
MSGAVEDPEEAAGPSVESETPQERIAARRFRIAAKNEAKRRQERGESCEKEVKEAARTSQVQVEQSERRMINLQSDGTELVTNVQVAADAKESLQRTELEDARRLREEKLEHEAKASLEKFEDITMKWQLQASQQQQQQQLCALLLEDKNKLINDLQQELKASDDCYVKDLKWQTEEVDLTIERMENQIKTLTQTRREELRQIENAYEDERTVLLTGNRKKWEQYMKERCDKELEHLTQRRKKVEEHEAMLQKLRVEDAEEYNIIKSKLDTDVQIMQRQLQQTKATYILNQEKLEYNYQLLTNREEENIMILSQQKKKITRQHDVVKNLKIKVANQEKQPQWEIQSFSEDYQRVVQQYKHLQKKMRHFAAIDAKTLEEVWLMNEAEVKELMERALDVDRLIYEQQLGLTWQRPHMSFMELSGPIQPQKASQRAAHHQRTAHHQRPARQAASWLIPTRQDAQVSPGMMDASVGPKSGTEIGTESTAMETFREGTAVQSESGADGGWREDSTAEEKGKVSVKTLKKVLELLHGEAGFLIESKLDKQSLRKLDSIFSALDIESEEDVYRLADFILEYTHQQREQTEVRSAESGESSNCAEGGESSSAASLTSHLIHPNEVLAALKSFAARQRSRCSVRESSAAHQPSLRSLRGRDDSEDAAYWESLANCIPEAKLKLWDALEKALDKYYGVLTERSELITATRGLKQQNTELRTLLHLSLNSRVSAHMESPPIQMMQLARR